MRIAIILGNGEYASELFKIKKLHPNALFISAIKKEESIIDDCNVYLHGDFNTMLALLTQTIHSQSITHIAIGGDFRLLEVKDVHIRGTDNLYNFRQNIDRTKLLHFIQATLEHMDVRACHVADFLPELQLHEGYITPEPHKIPESHLIEVGKACLPSAEKARFGSRHSIIFQDGKILDETTESTDDFLQNIASNPRKNYGYPRCLVRLIGRSRRATIDAPVISVKTVELASKAHVDAIILDSNSAIIYNKKDVLRECYRFNIDIYSFKPEN